jgi:hypothetical protein
MNQRFYCHINKILLAITGRLTSNQSLIAFHQPVGRATNRGKEFIILQRCNCSKKKVVTGILLGDYRSLVENIIVIYLE